MCCLKCKNIDNFTAVWTQSLSDPNLCGPVPNVRRHYAELCALPPSSPTPAPTLSVLPEAKQELGVSMSVFRTTSRSIICSCLQRLCCSLRDWKTTPSPLLTLWTTTTSAASKSVAYTGPPQWPVTCTPASRTCPFWGVI